MERVISLFIVWRVGLLFLSFVSPFLIPVFGFQFPYANSNLIPTNAPYFFWQFANFDGVHYLRMASGLISEYQQVFFPLYPLLIKFLTINNWFLATGLILSSLFFLTGLLIFYKLLNLDYEKKVTLKTILLLISFPTAFYFGAYYTESLFFLLSVLSIYLLRKKQFILSGFFISLACATRLIGIFLIILYLVEALKEIRSKKYGLSIFFGFLIAPTALLIYMLYLYLNFNDPFYFIHAQSGVGTGREVNNLVLLPQVIFRYLKIFTTVSIQSQLFLNALLEFTSTIFCLILFIFGWKKIRFSYFIFSFFVFLLPTFTGTLSSMPRYILMSFLMLPILGTFNFKPFYFLVTIFTILQVILAVLFLRGYWIS